MVTFAPDNPLYFYHLAQGNMKKKKRERLKVNLKSTKVTEEKQNGT